MIIKLWKILKYLFVGLGLFMLIQIPVLADGYWDWWGENSRNANVLAHWLVLFGLTLVVLLGLLKIYRGNFQKAPILKGMTWSMIGLAIVVAVIVVGIEMLLIAALSASKEAESSEIVGLIHGPLGLLTLVSSNLISPILEELLFRGVFQSFFARYFKLVTAIILTNVLFAIGHGYGLAATLGTLIVGCGLSLLQIKTQRLGTAMVGHISVNWLVTLINILG